MMTKTYTIEMKESRAKLIDENKTIVFNQGDVGTSIIKFYCKQEDGKMEDLTDTTAKVIAETPNTDTNGDKVVATQGTCTVDDSTGTVTVVLDSSLIDTVGDYVLQLQLVGKNSEIYTYTPKINYTVKDVIG